MSINTPLDWAREHAQLPEKTPALEMRGRQMPLIAIYAAPYNEQLVYQSASNGGGKPFHALPEDTAHGYYQYFFDAAEHGDIAIEITQPEQSTHQAKGERECWVSAWDKEKQQGIELGHITIENAANLTQELGDYVSQQPALENWLNQPSKEVQSPVSLLGRMMDSVKKTLGL